MAVEILALSVEADGRKYNRGYIEHAPGQRLLQIVAEDKEKKKDQQRAKLIADFTREEFRDQIMEHASVTEPAAHPFKDVLEDTIDRRINARDTAILESKARAESNPQAAEAEDMRAKANRGSKGTDAEDPKLAKEKADEKKSGDEDNDKKRTQSAKTDADEKKSAADEKAEKAEEKKAAAEEKKAAADEKKADEKK